MKFAPVVVPFAAVACVVAAPAEAGVLATRTLGNANHYGYFAFSSTSANNTKFTFTNLSGTARSIRVSGSITKVHPEAWAKSIQVQPSGPGLATYQPWFEFSELYDFEGTIPVGATIYAPGGFDLSRPLTFEMFSLDAEEFVPGLDARSTLTYTFDDAYPAGTVEYTGTLATTDPRFNRPIQFETNPPGLTQPFASGRFPHFDVQPFHVDTAGRYDLVSANEFESAGLLYRGSFDPSNPLANVVRALGQGGNVLRNTTFDNLPFGEDAVGGASMSVDLLPGVQYFFVTSAYDVPGASADGGPFVGDYHNLIAPAGGGASKVRLGLIPEPSTGAAVVASFALATRRKRRR